MTWERKVSPAPLGLYDVVWNGRLLVAVGAGGAILTASEDPMGISPRRFHAAGFPLRIGRGEILFSLPQYPRDQTVTAMVRTLTGSTAIGATPVPAGRGRLSARRLPSGTYVLELQGGDRRFARSFRFTR